MELLRTYPEEKIDDLCRACGRIVRPWIQQKIMGPLFSASVKRGLKDKTILIAEDKSAGGAIGFALWKNYQSEPTLLLQKFAVSKNHTANGVGQKLLSSLMKFAKEEKKSIRLRVAKVNEDGIKFYEKHGFKVVEDPRKRSDLTLTMYWDGK